MPGFPRLKDSYDFVIVGGGHAGLQAAVKAALLQFTAAVIDRGPKYSRSFYAPRMANIPGYRDGVSGHVLLDRQIEQVRRYEDRIGYFTPARAEHVRRTGDGFEVEFDWLKQRHTARGRHLILAHGVVDRIPEVQGKIDPIFPWANQAIVGFCTICDGHELPGKCVAVIGATPYAARVALELLHFRPLRVEILTHGHPMMAEAPATERDALLAELKEHGIEAYEPEMVGFDGIREKRFVVRFADGTTREYDRGFSGLGWYDRHAEFPQQLGAAFDEEGYVRTDPEGRVLSATDGRPIAGLFCIGDLRSGWNQIPEAWAAAERAVLAVYADPG